MAITVDFVGYVYNDAGVAIEGATVKLFDENTTSTALVTDTTDANGHWNISRTQDHDNTDQYDIEISYAGSVRRLKYDRSEQYTTLEVKNLRIRNPLNTFAYDIVPAALTGDDRVLTLPLITGTDTLATLGLAATFSAIMTHSADIILQDASDLALGTGSDTLIRWSTADSSNHAAVIAIGDTSQQIHITDKGAVATDWGRSAGTHPELAIHSNTTPADDYLAIGNHDGTTATVDVVGGTTLSIAIDGNSEATFPSAGLNLPANSDLVFTGTTGTNDIVLANGLADALSVTDGSADIIVVDTNTAGNVATFSSAVTVGVDDTGHDVTFFGATAGAFMLYDQSEDTLVVRGGGGGAPTGAAAAAGTAPLSLENDGNVYLQFRTPTSGRAGILAGDDDADNGIIWYQHGSTPEWEFYTGAAIRMTINANGIDMESHSILNVGATANDWTTDALTVAGSTSTQRINLGPVTGTGNGNAVLTIATTEESTGVAALVFKQGDGGGGDEHNMSYNLRYDGDNGWLELNSARTATSSGSAADIWRIPDEQLTMDFNSTTDETAFDDYDDAMVLKRAFSPEYRGGRDLMRNNRQELIDMGVLRQYDDGWVGYSDQRMAALLAGGIYQTRQRVDELDERIAALEGK